jgi:hypothetical protein
VDAPVDVEESVCADKEVSISVPVVDALNAPPRPPAPTRAPAVDRVCSGRS